MVLGVYTRSMKTIYLSLVHTGTYIIDIYLYNSIIMSSKINIEVFLVN